MASLIFLTVRGQCTAESRPFQIIATYDPQYISSPNYPEEYPEDQECAWIITSPSPDDRIIINLEEVAAEGANVPCSYDYVVVYDGGDDSATEVARLCNANNEDVNVMVSSSNQVYVTFISDWTFNEAGFNMIVFTNNTAYMPDCSTNTTLIATSQADVLMSPNLPDLYQSDFSCIVRIYPETAYFAVLIEMYFMDIENSTGCENDVLHISSVGETSTLEQVTGCSTALTYDFSRNFPLEASGVYVEINFSTNVADNYLGFLLKYSEIFKGINLTSPAAGETVELTVPEDQAIGHMDESVAVIMLTYTGSLVLQILPTYEATTEQNITLASNVQIFGLEESFPYLYLDLISSLDYEVINKFSLVITMLDTDVTKATYSVTFNITVTDVDDVAPVLANLPNNHTLRRDKKTGHYVFTVNATDDDATLEYRRIAYEIFDGDIDSMFALDAASGELTLARDADLIPLSVLDYTLTIAAFSASGGKLAAYSTFTVHVFPDSPPVCTNSTVWAETIDINLSGAGTQVQLLNTWSCSDDNINITYTIESVSPNVTAPLFEIDNTTADITLLRRCNKTEAENRQFIIEIGVTDTVGQMVTFNLYMNISALSCYPNPRNVYVRMDQELGGAILSDFNCTHTYGLNYILQQYPEGTFAVDTAINGTALLILKAPVLKIKFYGLIVTLTDGVDLTVLAFRVIVQTRRCSPSGAVPVLHGNPMWTIAAAFYTVIICRIHDYMLRNY